VIVILFAKYSTQKHGAQKHTVDGKSWSDKEKVVLSSGKSGSSAATGFSPTTGNPPFTAHPANVWCAVREGQYF